MGSLTQLMRGDPYIRGSQEENISLKENEEEFDRYPQLKDL
ncbi:hypothetical protein SAMN02745220_04056 [Desulfopila aestuarii DSM 18488]|uniref:Uncharacterized protein n=1 Tax=Desulfopila aestuarii DSM 18488 TaxID=1121416 RepID=A0A1M7YFX4_9BACT|nr:hypothetical protein SAMN02745220_04056 [Desulfopila aestuarii DSM 18488]